MVIINNHLHAFYVIQPVKDASLQLKIHVFLVKPHTIIWDLAIAVYYHAL